MSRFAKLVGFDKKKSTVRIEIVAGIVTFLAMAYILTLNPILMLDGTNPHLYSSVFVATALGGFMGTMLIALYAKLPLAQAPGLGLNSMVGGFLVRRQRYDSRLLLGRFVLIFEHSQNPRLNDS